MTKPAVKSLVAQQDAILSYLDALLQEIPAEPEAAPGEEIQDWDPAALAPPAAVAPVVVRPVVSEPPAAPAVEAVAEQAPAVVKAPAVEPAPPVVQAEPAPAAPPAPQGPPDWAQPSFQALLFQVGALNLAVPLIKLHSVVPWPEQGVTPMPNQPHWCLGLLRYRDRNVRIVDTARLVLPPDKRREPVPARHILVVGDGRWGLTCSSIGEVLRLEPEEVKWRTAAGRRPWLAGTVVDHLCALLDTEAFGAMLGGTAKQSAPTTDI